MQFQNNTTRQQDQQEMHRQSHLDVAAPSQQNQIELQQANSPFEPFAVAGDFQKPAPLKDAWSQVREKPVNLNQQSLQDREKSDEKKAPDDLMLRIAQDTLAESASPNKLLTHLNRHSATKDIVFDTPNALVRNQEDCINIGSPHRTLKIQAVNPLENSENDDDDNNSESDEHSNQVGYGCDDADKILNIPQPRGLLDSIVLHTNKDQFNASETILDEMQDHQQEQQPAFRGGLFSQREQRACNKERKNYSQVHKGLVPTMQVSQTSVREQQQGKFNQLNQKEYVLQGLEPTPRKPKELHYHHHSSQESHREQNYQVETHQRFVKRSFQDILGLYQNITSFDWDQKDIKNLKQSPDGLFTPIVYWFWMNSQYFPFDGQLIARRNTFESMIKPILQLLKVKQLEEIQEGEEEPELISRLYAEDSYLKWRDFLCHFYSTDKAQDLTTMQFDNCLTLLEQELEQLQDKNEDQARGVFEKFKNAFSEEGSADLVLHSALNMFERPQSFLSYVDPAYVRDIDENIDWYLQNSSEILLNINYPSRKEKDFLRQLELWQQEKNDVNYKHILNLLQNDNITETNDHSRWQQLSAHKRGLVVQEDAQCAICNNGDYEDEDLIVFCGVCNIPVHQRCYGIDEVPENDWICNNCSCLAFKRGLQIRCVLCPKKGGAMKPTSVFSSYEHYQRYHKAAAKKKGLNSQTFLSISNVNESEKPTRQQLFEREDKNHALSQILNRECNFQDCLIQQRRQSSTPMFPQEEVDFHFLQTELDAPEDYDFFLQRNSKLLDQAVASETLYEWVHLSCAMWIPGPIVTPKTPVRLSKLDCKRFQLQCIICGLRNEGACFQCQHSQCQISFHIECARRSNYFMEVEKVDRERHYKIFCEKHRPLKIVKEQEERDRQAVDEVFKFARLIEKCYDINQRVQDKVLKVKKIQSFSRLPKFMSQSLVKKQQSGQFNRKSEKCAVQQQREIEKLSLLEQKKAAKLLKQERLKEAQLQRKLMKEQQQQQKHNLPKKWREKDKSILLERIKVRYLQLLKLRLSVILVDPASKLLKQQERLQKRQKSLQQQEERKRNKKIKEQQQLFDKELQSNQREGLRKRLARESSLLSVDKLQESHSLPIQDAALHEETQTFHQLLEQDIQPYFKFGNPVYLQELDWGITLSKYEFPWLDIAQGMNFTPKECYEKYISLVRDPQTFLRKVLNSNSSQQKEKYTKLMQNQMDQAPRIVLDEEPKEDIFCICKGANQSGFFVACDGGEAECPHGGWLHPECTEELRNLEREVIENMEGWYCQDCRHRIQEEENDKPQSACEEKELELLEAEMAADEQEIAQLREGIAAQNNEENENEYSHFKADSIEVSSLSAHDDDSHDQA